MSSTTPAPREVLLLVSIDTEEDNWNRARTGVTVENIRQLPRRAVVSCAIEALNAVWHRGAADADGGGLPEAGVGQLLDRLVGEGAAAGDDADLARFVDIAGHDPHLALAGGDDAGTVGADEARFVEVDGGGGANHVDDGNTFGDAYDERNFGVGGFEDGVSSIGGRDKDH